MLSAGYLLSRSFPKSRGETEEWKNTYNHTENTPFSSSIMLKADVSFDFIFYLDSSWRAGVSNLHPTDF